MQAPSSADANSVDSEQNSFNKQIFLLGSSPDESLRLSRLVVPHEGLVSKHVDGEGVDDHIGGCLAPKFPPVG